VHGLHVSPAGNGDNPFISVAPGQSYEYEFVLPTDHPPGTFWYHPHHHGLAADQVAAGLYGAIIVQDPAPIPVSRERVLIVSDISLDGDGQIEPVSLPERMMGREGRTVLVNGQVRPALQAAPGERERWRLINACPARYLNLQLEGPRYQLLALDGRLLAAVSDTGDLLLAPGNRADVLVTPGEGRWTLRTNRYDRGSMAGMMMGGGTSTDTPSGLLSFDARGDPVPEPGPVPRLPALRDLREEPVTGRRRLDFSMGTGRGMGPAAMGFTINGKEFDASRVDETVSVGSVEEWTLSNSSPMDHPMHLHVWPMQIIQDGARDLTEPQWQDVVNIPANGEVKVRVAFDSFPGHTVFHCHILDHEDLGMMGVLEAR
jgi:FtsP/CotA-like multicopper oxidase with cupredoxin domain